MIKLNGQTISIRKFKILFGESATKTTKRMIKVAGFYHYQETVHGILEVIGVNA